jgi:hypothetical protein
LIKKISKKKIGAFDEKNLYRNSVDLLLAAKEKLAEAGRVDLETHYSYRCLGCGQG